MACPETMTVDCSLLPVKAAYFCALAAMASLLPYLVVFMKQYGLSPTELALIFGMMPFVGAIVRTPVGALVDKFCCHKVALIVFCLLSAILHGVLVLISCGVIAIYVPPEKMMTKLACHSDGSYLSRCDGITCQDVIICHQRESIESQYSLASYQSALANTSIDDELASVECRWHCHVKSDIGGEFCHGNGSTELCVTSKNETMGGLQELELKDPQLSLAVEYLNQTTSCSRYLLGSYTYGPHSYRNLTCRDPMQLDCSVECEPHAQSKRYGRTFWTFALIIFPAQVAWAPVFSLLDALTYSLLAERVYLWGKQRLWGTMGFGMLAFLSGISMDLTSDGTTTNYTSAIVLFATCQLACGIAVFLYPSHPSSHQTARAPKLRETLTLLTVPSVPSLLCLVFLFGAYAGLIETFVFWHLQTLSATPPPQLLFGLCMITACVPEVGVLFATSWIISRIGGHNRCLCVVCVAFAVRMISYSLLQHPWLVLLIEPLHGITFGLMYAVISAHASQVTPPGLHGTVQGIISALYFGIGRGVGSLLGGKMFEVFGARQTFRAYGISALCVLPVYVALEFKAGRMARGADLKQQQPEELELEMKTKPSETIASEDDSKPFDGLLKDTSPTNSVKTSDKTVPGDGSKAMDRLLDGEPSNA